MRLIDSHCHLQAEPFVGEVEVILEAARAAGVERILVPGWDGPSSLAALALAQQHPWLDAAAGIHPHHSAQASPDEWASVVDLAADPRVVALGETGLDFDRRFSPPEAQLENLRRHLRLGLETAKPVILHCRSAVGERDAQDALLAELHVAGYGGPLSRAVFRDRPPAILHSFSGPVDYAAAALDLGLAVSFSGLVFRRGEEPTGEVVALVPADRLLVETDSPWLAPPGAPRRRNAPEWVRLTAGWVAEHRGEVLDGEVLDALGEGLVATYDRVFPRATSR